MSDRRLPAHWVNATVGEVIDPVASMDPGACPEARIDYIDIGSIDSQRGVVTAPKSLLGSEAPLRARQTVRPGDVLFSTVRPYLRAIAAVPCLQRPVASTGFCVLRPASGVDPRYLLHWVRSTEFVDGVLPLQRGSSYPAVRDADVHLQPLPLAPAAEQERIAERLDELLTGLDEATAELTDAKRKLALYRQSLLKSAVEGTLTAEWRGSRRRDNGAGSQTACTDVPTWLPPGWRWLRVDQLPGISMSNGRSVPTAADGARVLRLTAVRAGRIDLGEYKLGAWSDSEALPFAVREGDLLVVRGNGSLALVGRAGVVPAVTQQVAYPDTLIRVRCDTITIRPAWLACVWDSELVRNHLERRARTSAGIYKISQPDIASATLPLPPLDEQEEALAALDTELSRVASIEQSLALAERAATAQRQNILRAAFSGQLVPQDPNDEPASVLLERIRAQHDAAGDKPTARRTRKAKIAA